MLDLIRTVAPAETPVSLAQCKAHLKVEHSDDDAIIAGYLDSAVAELDGYSGLLGRALVAQTWVLHLPAFPSSAIELPLPPLIEVTGVTYVDTAGETQDVPAEDMEVLEGPVSWLLPAYGRRWPGDVRRTPRAVSVTFRCGWASAAHVPPPIQSAILLSVEQLYAGHDDKRQRAIDRLIAPVRKLRV